MITLRGLTKRYGDKVAVDGLSLEVAAGKVTGLAWTAAALWVGITVLRHRDA
ncbi:hypothetical protein [Actinomadura sp. BRA 177]|uniref:hypothetical protein n=1 Tax=Actinomadura sp. BRA 177 TaxID=2745202 RepID=UPI0020CDC8D8|nr:hypothetical protein [Actinomadura sp. BRA 177]